jgi:hypothetical protein
MPAAYAEDRLHHYLAHWNRDPSNVSKIDVAAISWATDEERRERQTKYYEVGSDYYDLVTPLYEQGWYVYPKLELPPPSPSNPNPKKL